MPEEKFADDQAPARRVRRPAALRLVAEGSYRSVSAAWGVNFGRDSDVDQVIPGSGGRTLRQLKDAGEIRADCFVTVSEEG